MAFKYFNYLGIVSSEFPFHPSEGHEWETERLVWVPYAEVVADMEKNPGDYHPGLLKLFQNSKDAIERALNIKQGKTAAHNPSCKCEMCRSIPAWKRPWLTGKCHEFALALSSKMPDAQFVAIGGGMFEHVGLRRGDAYYDVRGKMTKDQFAELFGSNADSVRDVSREEVLHDSFPSYIGYENELAETSDFKSALKAVRRVFGGSKNASLDGMQPFYHGTSWAEADKIEVEGLHAHPWQFNGKSYVWCTLVKQFAASYGESKTEDEGTGYAVVSFEWDYDRTEPDPEHLGYEDVYRRIEGNVPASAVIGIDYYTADGDFVKTAGQAHMFPSSQDAKFRAWFDGSKVVDKKGNPIPVYHGTRSSVDFEEFAVDGPPYVEGEDRATSSGSGADPTAYLGAHFAEESNVANMFAEGKGWTSTRYEGEAEKPRVLKVYLRIANPKDFGSELNLRNFIYQGKIADDDVLQLAMQNDGIQYWDENEATDKAVEDWYAKYDNDQNSRMEQNAYLFEYHSREEGDEEALSSAAFDLARDAKRRLATAGHDGVRYKNVVEGGTAWIAFDPSQIKSVYAQQFNPKDPRYTASVKTAKKYYHGGGNVRGGMLDVRKGQTGAISTLEHPDMMYHYGGPEDRASIQNKGLLGPMSQAIENGVFLDSKFTPEAEGKYTDIWEVNVKGLELDPDWTTDISGRPEYEGSTWWIFYGDIPPNRLKLVHKGKMAIDASWAKKAAGFAFKSFKKLWHVGSMNPEDKRDDSYEGAGLSVSIHPDEWRQIARIGGDLWELTKKGNKFVNFHRLSKAQRGQIADWGVENGYAQPAQLWRHSWFDDEENDERYSDYTTKEEAEGELGNYENDKVEPVEGGLVATPKLSQKSKRGKIDPGEVTDLLVTAYAEDELDCDGVWWADTFSPASLSAPRGVIFPSKLPSWAKKKLPGWDEFGRRVSKTRTASKVYTPEEVETFFRKIHDSDADLRFDENYALRTVAIKDLRNFTNLPGDNPRVSAYVKRYNEGSPFPPVILNNFMDVRDGSHRVSAAMICGLEQVPAFVPVGKAAGKQAAEWKRLPATPEWVSRAKVFLKEKWDERHKELGREGIPTDLSGACKFASLFAHKLFGGKMVGTAEHQALSLGGGKMLDLADLFDPDTFRHDKEFWKNPEHEESMKSCGPRVQRWVDEPRVQQWVDEFYQKYQIEVFKTHMGSDARLEGLSGSTPQDIEHMGPNEGGFWFADNTILIHPHLEHEDIVRHRYPESNVEAELAKGGIRFLVMSGGRVYVTISKRDPKIVEKVLDILDHVPATDAMVDFLPFGSSAKPGETLPHGKYENFHGPIRQVAGQLKRWMEPKTATGTA